MIANDDELYLVYQPVVDLRTRRVFAYEALARSRAPEFGGPIELFAAATKAGPGSWGASCAAWRSRIAPTPRCS